MPTSMLPTQMILVRLMIAKVEDPGRLAQLLREVPVKRGQEGWNCVSWVKEALANIATSTKIIGTGVVEWGPVRDKAMSYCQQKKDEHRFDGEGNFDRSKVATFDLMQKKETMP